MKKKLLTSLCLVSLALGLTACKGAGGRIPDKKEVLKYVDSVCGEEYELTGRKLVEETPDNMEYYFESKERDLSFKANSYLSPIGIDGSDLPFYNDAITTDYVSQVHDIYREDVEEVLTESEQYLEKHGWFYVCEFEDLNEVVDTCIEADKIYGRESKYNSREFMEKNPVLRVHLVWQTDDAAAKEHKHWVNITNINLTGHRQREELFDDLAQRYAVLFVDGEIPYGEDIPEKYKEDLHVSNLDTITLNGEEMLYDDNDCPYNSYGLINEGHKRSWYNYDLDSYMMSVDIGLIMESQSMVLINREYVNALGGDYDLENTEEKGAKTCISSWKIDGDEWVLKILYADGRTRKLKLEKNGEEIPMDFVTVDEDPHAGASFSIGVTADDFCKLFDLTYEVDEDNGAIHFYSEN